jgi:cell division protein FtsQ
MNIVKKSAVWVVTLVYLILVFGFVDNRYEEQLCNQIRVSIKDSTDTRFLSSGDIIRRIQNEGIKYLGLKLKEIELEEIENVIMRNQLVQECKAYTGINGTLHIDILQREPLVRVIEAENRSYYIDREGNVLNLSSHFTPHILVVNGRIRTSLRIGQPINIYQTDSTRTGQLLRDILELAQFIQNDDFWKAQIVQVYVNKDGEFELIPRIGPHIIILGKLTDYREKFDKLELFYKEGLNHVGWNQYVKINLKYKDQIVCSKI